MPLLDCSCIIPIISIIGIIPSSGSIPQVILGESFWINSSCIICGYFSRASPLISICLASASALTIACSFIILSCDRIFCSTTILSSAICFSSSMLKYSSVNSIFLSKNSSKIIPFFSNTGLKVSLISS